MPTTFQVDYWAYEHFTIPDGVDLKKVQRKWIRWGTLYYVIDGICYSVNGSGTEIDEKFPIDQWGDDDTTDEFFDSLDYHHVSDDDDKPVVTVEGKYDLENDHIIVVKKDSEVENKSDVRRKIEQIANSLLLFKAS